MQSFRQYQKLERQARGCQSSKQDVEKDLTGEPSEVRLRDSREPSTKIIVDWESKSDPLNPANYSTLKRVVSTLLVGLVGFVLQVGASIDSAVVSQAAESLGVSDVAESLVTGIYLIGLGFGTLICGPFSETFGRNMVYIGSLSFFLAWQVGAALSPNFGAQMVFRFLAGFFASPCLTVSGGTIADLWNPLEKTWAFPLYALLGFGGAFLGPVISSWIDDTGSSWRFADWLVVILTGFSLALIVFLQPETFGPILLKWKAINLRKSTGDQRYQAPIEQIPGFISRLAASMRRPFEMSFSEVIIIAFTLYLTVAYIVTFTFLSGLDFVYSDTYGLSHTLTEVSFTAITKRNHDDSADGYEIQPELRLLYAMIGAPWMPISLFWMGWTDSSSVNVWSVVTASVFFGFSAICIFLSAYMYIIDSYGTYAASALTFVALVRYLAAGGMTVASIPFYQNMGTHYTLTILACISAVMVPVPYMLHHFGSRIRGTSRFAA
ncbi:MAG: hypothetical protein Q9165_006641 [Trypethelium subeluteriae]